MRTSTYLVLLAGAVSFVSAAPENKRRQLDPFNPGDVSSFVQSVSSVASEAQTKGETVVISGTTHTISIATDGVIIDGTTTVSATTMVDGINIDGSRVVGIGVITAPSSGETTPANGPGSSASTTANGSGATQSASTQTGAAESNEVSIKVAGLIVAAVVSGLGLF